MFSDFVKCSRYNIVNRMSNGQFLVYNTLSSSVAVLSESEMQTLVSKERCDDSFSEQCYSMGFLVPKAENELKKVNCISNMNNFNTSRAGIQILPTTGCNAKCFYCYEEGFCIETMSDETAEKTIAFLKDFFAPFKEVSIAWFGGEPLLRFDIIEKISKEIIPFLESKKISYSSNIITNATLLDKGMIEKLNDYHINKIQITIDGFEGMHDDRKNYSNPDCSYSKIISKIKLLSESNINTLVRFNVDRKNADSCIKALYDIKGKIGNADNVWPYFAPLYSDKGYDACISSDQLSDYYKEFYKALIDCEYIQTINGLPMNFQNATCCAKMINNYVISPKGQISKCEHLLDCADDLVGDVENGIIFNDAMVRWSNTELDDDCKNCSYLPLCQSGCYAAMKRKFGYGKCSYVKFLNEAVVFATEYLLEKNKKKGG